MGGGTNRVTDDEAEFASGFVEAPEIMIIVSEPGLFL